MSQNCKCCSYSSGLAIPPVLAGLGAFFSMFNYIWCLTDLLATLLSVPILILVLLPACIRVSKSTFQVAAGLCMVNVILEIVSCFCYGTIFDVITIIMFFLAGIFCIVQAPQLDTLLPTHTAHPNSTGDDPWSQPTATAVPMPMTDAPHHHPPVSQTVVTTINNPDGSVTKTTQVIIRNPDGSQTVTERTEIEATHPHATIVPVTAPPPAAAVAESTPSSADVLVPVATKVVPGGLQP